MAPVAYAVMGRMVFTCSNLLRVGHVKLYKIVQCMA